MPWWISDCIYTPCIKARLKPGNLIGNEVVSAAVCSMPHSFRVPFPFALQTLQTHTGAQQWSGRLSSLAAGTAQVPSPCQVQGQQRFHAVPRPALVSSQKDKRIRMASNLVLKTTQWCLSATHHTSWGGDPQTPPKASLQGLAGQTPACGPSTCWATTSRPGSGFLAPQWQHKNQRGQHSTAPALLQAAHGPTVSTRLSSHHHQAAAVLLHNLRQPRGLQCCPPHPRIPVCSPGLPLPTPALCFSSGSAGAAVQSPRTCYFQAQREGKKSLVRQT